MAMKLLRIYAIPDPRAYYIEANIAANDARLEQVAADHDKSVLQALEEVEGAYGRIRFR